MLRYESDVIVIGAGIAGVTAAIELLERGRRVLLLDRDVEENMARSRRKASAASVCRHNRCRSATASATARNRARDWHAFAEFGPRGSLAARLGRGLRAPAPTRRSSTGCAASACSSCP